MQSLDGLFGLDLQKSRHLFVACSLLPATVLLVHSVVCNSKRAFSKLFHESKGKTAFRPI
jgi:hypothetical protein